MTMTLTLTELVRSSIHATKMVILHRHLKVDEEFCGLLGADKASASSNGNGAATPKSTHHVRSAPNVRDTRFSTAILVCCVFLLGVKFGSHSSSNGVKSTIMTMKSTPRDVHVGSMCRCGSGKVPIPAVNRELLSMYQQVPKNPAHIYGQDTVIQPPSKATGSEPKRFVHHPVEGCKCFGGDARLKPDTTADKFMSRLSRDYFLRPANQCQESEEASQFNWDQMPDFGVQDLPIFVGVLSFSSPLTLNNTLHNWLKHDLFHRIGAQDVMIQLNQRTREDDEIVYDFQQKLNNRHPMTILGSEDENLHPGLAISNFCRRAEQHPSSHPNGENLVLFLEKDWIIPDSSGRLYQIEDLFRSAIALSQRGVPYVSLRSNQVRSNMWNCPAEGVGWTCTTSHKHRWTNHPVLVSCNWFLRYLEPYALLSDPIMHCGSSHVHRLRDGYCDWEEALQDGRVAWTNSQWVMAHLPREGGGQLFVHEEVDL